PNLVDGANNTALHISGYNGNFELSDEIIRRTNRLLVNVPNNDKKTPMDMVIDGRVEHPTFEHTKVLALLKIHKGRSLNPKEQAVAGPEYIERVIEEALTAELFNATEKLDKAYGIKLIQAGAEVNPTYLEPRSFDTNPLARVITRAMQEKQLTKEMMAFAGMLIDYGAKVGAPFILEMHDTNAAPTSLVELLNHPYLDPKIASFIYKMKAVQEANDLLFEAAFENDPVKGKAALDAHANINARIRYGITPLLFGVTKGHTEFSVFAIKNSADLEAVTTTGLNVLHMGTHTENTELFDMLLAELKSANKSITIRTGNDIGNEPIHEATMLKKMKMVEKIASAGGDVNAENEVNESPLQIALLNNDPKMADLLFGLGAKVTDYLIEFASDFLKNEDMATELKAAKQVQDREARESGVVELPAPQARAEPLQPVGQPAEETLTNVVEFVPFKKPDDK
ncbi:MAG: hypothetical protein V1492_03465, partial [Candidatus Micrarchaeota archaeon]